MEARGLTAIEESGYLIPNLHLSLTLQNVMHTVQAMSHPANLHFDLTVQSGVLGIGSRYVNPLEGENGPTMLMCAISNHASGVAKV